MMKKFTTILTMYLFYISQIQFSFADDIELYQSGDTGIRPNVTFVLDTSGSMNEKVTLEGTFYDPDETYPGPFRNDRLYFFELPESETDLGDLKIFKDAILDNTIHPDAFRCQTHEDVLENKGYAVGKFLQWDGSQYFKTKHWYLKWGWLPALTGWIERQGVWKTLRASEDPDRYVDCQSDLNYDNGKGHGAVDGASHTYMTNEGNGTAYTNDKGAAVPNTVKIWGDMRPLIPGPGRGYWLCLFRLCAGATETVYTGNYLNYDFATQNGVTRVPRLYYMGQIISDAIAQYPGLNVALGRYDGRLLGDISFNFDGNIFTNPITYDPPQGGMIAIEAKQSEGHALEFENTIKSWDAWGATPLTESYYEAVRYIKGQSVKYGDRTKVFATRDSFLGLGGTYHRYPSVAGSRVNGDLNNSTYQSPMTESCQPNHVILFSDGSPTDDVDANPDIRTMISSDDFPSSDSSLSKSCDGDGGCANELAFHLANNDQFDDASFPGTQTIVTHAIAGLITDVTEAERTNALMKGIADSGQGIYKEAKDPAQVREALHSIFGSILENSVSFTAPVVSVNAFNSLELSDELYYSVFKPSKNLSWDGNVKQYKMGTHNEEFAVVDAKNKPAIDPDSGYFAEGALSIWTPETDYPNGDGAIVTDGGLAHHLPSSRTVYTSDNSGLVNLSPATASKTQLGISTKDAEFHQKLIDWGLGKDAFDADNDGDVNESRRRMQDPLHSEPTIITYYKERAKSADQSDTIDRTMFIGTNGGFLHAFDIDKESPDEYFSFIPKELLHNLELYHSGGGILATKAYGIDGPVTHWHKDANGNKIVDNGEKVYVYFSLRRGGHSYYALDVSDRSAPKLLWEKHGPYPADFPNKPAVSPGYENLGQTWSRMETATVKWNGADKVVLFASGGYDPVEDGDMASGDHRTGPLSRTAHTVGTTIYMIDALTGDVLWDAKKHSGVGGQMTSSFPAHVAPVDINRDGYADVIFASDVGGRIWRFDTNTEAKGSADFASGRIVADLYEGAGPGNRRFYNEVDVIGSEETEQIFLSIGSGNRSHPGTYGATAAQNHHYIIKETMTPPKAPAIITHADLAAFPAASDYGWYVPMVHPGEKVLARSNTVGDQVLFSTFSPKISATPTCDASPGYSRAYKLDLSKGIMQMAQTQSGGIPPMPMLIPPKRKGKETCTVAGVCEPTPPPSSDQEYSVLVGTEVVKFEDPVRSPYGSIFKDYWLERQQ